MDASTWRSSIVGSFTGGMLGLIVGAVWVALAPDNGFGDLAAATVTAVVLVPVGVAAGFLASMRRRWRPAGNRHSEEPRSRLA